MICLRKMHTSEERIAYLQMMPQSFWPVSSALVVSLELVPHLLTDTVTQTVSNSHLRIDGLHLRRNYPILTDKHHMQILLNIV
jgi:hypothetical protein